MTGKSSLFENVVIAFAAVLAGIVTYYGVEWCLANRGGGTRAQAAVSAAQVKPELATLAVAASRQPGGVSRSFVAVNSVPAMALSKTGHLTTRTKAPPAPRAAKKYQ